MSEVAKLVTQIIEMDKELQSLRTDVLMLKKELNGKENQSDNTVLDKIAIKYGRKKLYENVFYYYNRTVNAKRKDGRIDGEVVYTDFDKWAIGCAEYNEERIPVDVSVDEVIEYFKDELIKKYKKQCDEAYARLLKSEQEESEDEE